MLMANTAAPIERIARFDIPPSIFESKSYREAHAVVSVIAQGDPEPDVVGTEDLLGVELYGWRSPVAPHQDAYNHGWVYGLVLSLEGKETHLYAGDPKGNHISLKLQPGDLFVLDDSVKHWTLGEGVAVAMFSGRYDRREDAKAIRRLGKGLYRLAQHEPHAPRVAQDYRADRFLSGQICA